MNQAKVKAALEITNNIQTYSEKVGVTETDTQINVPDFPDSLDQDISGEFLTQLVEAANTDAINSIYEKRVEDHSETVRSIELLDVAMKSYEFIRDHWSEIFFILTVLERTGKLDWLKKNPKMRTIVNLFFDKKEEQKKEKEDQEDSSK